jgi:hypothetical protein
LSKKVQSNVAPAPFLVAWPKKFGRRAEVREKVLKF